MESLPPPPPQPLSAPADHTHPELRKVDSPTSLPEAYIYNSIQPACDDHDSGKCQTLTYELPDLELNPQYHCFFSVAICAESHYDVPPRRKGMTVTVGFVSVCDGGKLFLWLLIIN